MAHNGDPLVKLSDSSLVLGDPNQNLRGLGVYDRDEEKVGTVEDLYVGGEERKVRFLEVGAGGFLGIGKRYFLIPLEAVTDASENRVSIDQSRDGCSPVSEHTSASGCPASKGVRRVPVLV
jgi:sporulation protein YlmC with PRC-barrel domain